MWRRTDLASYRAGSPQWETVLSVDELNRAEGESWVYKGHTLYRPRDGSPPTRTLMELSRGGADAVVLREFDIVAKRFVPPSEGGFVVPEAKTRVAWQSADVLLIGTQFPGGDGGDGAAASLTDSGYPRTIREWRSPSSTSNPDPDPDPDPGPNPNPNPNRAQTLPSPSS